MLSQQEISDRLEITDVLLRYTHAVDSLNWDLFRQCFTPDAVIDYTCFGGPRDTLEPVTEFLAQNMPNWLSMQHMIGPPLIEVTGDEATARTICYNPMGFDRNGETGVLVCGLWYVDRLRRTDDGWKITERVEERSYVARYSADPVPVPDAPSDRP